MPGGQIAATFAWRGGAQMPRNSIAGLEWLRALLRAALQDELALGVLHDQDRARRVTNDIFRDAAGEQVFDQTQPMLAHHDQLDSQLSGARHNLVARTAASGGAKNILHPSGALVRLVEQPTQILACRVPSHIRRRIRCSVWYSFRHQRFDRPFGLYREIEVLGREYVHQKQLRVELAGKADTILYRRLRWLSEIRWN